ncbi:MAG TPA: crossover junction endodeoxyribonuclease RuvC [Dissulfurispiraceae bacterium]|nr:crossover junction endodeoxyribonuclease RuvC [Dissulfurispiraceae bacterium]
MRILGIDPGSINCGYGFVIAAEAHSRVRAGAGTQQIVYGGSGRIVMSAAKALEVRLSELFRSLREVIEESAPDVIAVERIFFAKSTKSALTLGHTRGVILLAIAESGRPLAEYSALEVKKAVVGYGRAEKAQVESMVRRLLDIRHNLSPDSSDALALALCHAHQTSFAASGKRHAMRSRKPS